MLGPDRQRTRRREAAGSRDEEWAPQARGMPAPPTTLLPQAVVPASQQPGDNSHHPLFAPQRALNTREPTNNRLWDKRGTNL